APEHGGVEAGSANGARAYEVLVALEDPGLRLEIGGIDGGVRPRTWSLPDLVARTLVREEPGRDRPDGLAPEDRAQLARARHDAAPRERPPPPLEHFGDLAQAVRRD